MEGLFHTADNTKITVHYRTLTQSDLINTISNSSLCHFSTKILSSSLLAVDVTPHQPRYCSREIDKCMFSTETYTESLEEVHSLCQNNGCIFMEKL